MINQLIHHFYYRFAKPINEENTENKYDPKYITSLLRKRQLNGKAYFYFKNKTNYIVIFANGQINVKGEEGMFRTWGNSEYKDFKPHNLFEKLEKEISRIKVPQSRDGSSYHFDSYGEFLKWLTG
ncbi:MAG: hypothetical protein ACRENT_09510 [Thermodesulfobacteriota bacterium]